MPEVKGQLEKIREIDDAVESTSKKNSEMRTVWLDGAPLSVHECRERSGDYWREVLEATENIVGLGESFCEERLLKTVLSKILVTAECILSPKGGSQDFIGDSPWNVARNAFVSGNSEHIGIFTSVLNLGFETWTGFLGAVGDAIGKDIILDISASLGLTLESARILSMALGRGQDIVLKLEGAKQRSSLSEFPNNLIAVDVKNIVINSWQDLTLALNGMTERLLYASNRGEYVVIVIYDKTGAKDVTSVITMSPQFLTPEPAAEREIRLLGSLYREFRRRELALNGDNFPHSDKSKALLKGFRARYEEAVAEFGWDSAKKKSLRVCKMNTLSIANRESMLVEGMPLADKAHCKSVIEYLAMTQREPSSIFNLRI
jgi:hypothetical protein